MQRLHGLLMSGLKGTLIILMAVITFSVTWGVFTRYVLNAAASWTGELSGYCLAWITFIGSAYAIFQKTHIRFESLIEVLPRPIRLTIETIFSLAMLFFVSVLLVYGGRLALNSMGDETLSLPVTKGIIFLVLPISGAIMFIGFLVELIQLYRGDKSSSTKIAEIDKAM
ncbi:TRAP transporter small permease [Ammoniphilus resinae]|uniref:TRAP-type C4-dicarboxylate transport system permease small subunit n=1 Tax=Ammoniphilus resinae TaxID=861532 RepID=A0ABS4GR34_9BACL|nr:TRAP transporter small permease [Ammoniphilus resinae]MBP1932719.1 TRAP-type C4-dicarboxylate transport system permease small subunit [Ammoniphilus resinae]